MRDALPDLEAPDLQFSNPIVVHPRDEVTHLTRDGSGNLSGTLYLPYVGQLYLLVDERTSQALVVAADNQTDVQADVQPAGVRLPVIVGDRIVVYRFGSDQIPEIVGIYEVQQT